MSADRVVLRFTKWGGREHWQLPLRRLGEDAHGVWLGGVTGTQVTRPGAAYALTGPLVMLVPPEQPWVATFYGPGHRHDTLIYVDMATPAAWSEAGAEVTMVDLDLDVFRTRAGDVLVDDEDEFAHHQVLLGYPDDVVRMAERSRDTTLEALLAGRAPFAESSWQPWLASLG